MVCPPQLLCEHISYPSCLGTGIPYWMAVCHMLRRCLIISLGLLWFVAVPTISSRITALQHEFATAPWNICDIFDDIDDSVWVWETLYNYIIDHHIPIRKVKIRSNSLPWMSSSLRKEMNKRYKLLTLTQNTPKGSNEWSTYKNQRIFALSY